MNEATRSKGLPLHPLLRAEIEARRSRPPYRVLGVTEVRRLFREGQTAGTPGPAIASVAETFVAGAAGRLRARLYRPQTDVAPLIVYFHGGGFTIGDLDTHDRNARDLAHATGAALLSVDYRLAPEHPFPAAFDDTVAAIRAVAADAAPFGGDAARLFLAGDSAGATLALAAALALRGSDTRIAGIVTYYPGVDFSHVASPSYEAFGDGSFGLSRDDTDWFRTLYAPDPADRLDWRCSPALAADHSGLPPTLIVVAAYDVLRDDDLAFAARLKKAGVEVTLRLVEGVNHGFMGAPNPPPAVAETLAFVRDWFVKVASPADSRR
ncbi:MAG TPA: alpha/beta hydrolase [Bauldia sp.]|nr:alpha/beta hydrolase [Bauldia sp.]